MGSAENMQDLNITEAWIDIENITEKGKIFAKHWQVNSHQQHTPIILLHDSLGSVQLWRDFPEQLAQTTERDVIAYDRLGFGQSSAHPSTLALDFVSDEAQQCFAHVLQYFQIQNFIVMGHSVGGGMATCCATTYPTRCQALITLSAQSMVEERTLNGIRQAKVAFQQDGQIDRLKKYHGEKAQWVLNAWTETWLSEQFSTWRLDDFLQQVHCPLLCMHGEFDEYGSIEQPQRFVQQTKGSSQLQIIQGAYHMPHKEKPEQVLKLIQDFLIDQHII